MTELAHQITRAASLQTYHTIALLVDRRRRDNAYRAYAYFRWLDDWLDGPALPADDRQLFVERQRAFVQGCYAGRAPGTVCDEERMLIELIRSDPDPRSPLAAYVINMMAVMAFDAARRDRLISRAELASYQHSLAVAVTEAMYYFVGGGDSAPRTPDRYSSVTAAHVTHMLRDTYDDLRAGYYNVSLEFLRQHDLSPQDVDSAAYRKWVQMRVEFAREQFRLGRRYLSSSGSVRCRLAGASYAARFEIVLDLIEGDGYGLRSDYGECKTLSAGLNMAGALLLSALGLDANGRLHGGADPHGATGLQ